ncbi:MAG TPA: glycoside hydrolase family 9 protein, partial [Opitutaceae bacterium]|nr:glycoside hydrolase family 9 protein [Opitutaceae bacterium]
MSKRTPATDCRHPFRTALFAAFTAIWICSCGGRARAAELVFDGSLRMPAAGDYGAHLLTPSLIELTFITSPPAGAPPPTFPGKMRAEDFHVTVDGQPVAVAKLGFKRRALYAPLKARDLRVATNVYLQLATPAAIGANGEAKPRIAITNANSGLWPESVAFTPKSNQHRFNPAIHVNQEGYAPEFAKTAMVGYYLGSLGELSVPAESGFELIDSWSGDTVFTGKLVPRRDAGFTYSPKPYQAVLEADFTEFKTAGEYRLFVPGLGASLPFRIHEGALMNFARAYALGLYHQRCGCALELPYTRFTHAACHTAPAEVPVPASEYRKAWKIIAELENGQNDKTPHQLKSEGAQLYPFVRTGKIDTRGGHHDAGDYSKYTTNSATLIHTLMFAVDSLPGVAELDNLGIPESGDGISDVMQEAKWESDFLAKLQDEDGGFYFLVYPKDRRYEGGVTPDHGDPQIVWPKNTAATGAATAALAQCAASPAFQKAYPREARRYLAAAERGWKFLLAALDKHGREGAYQRLTHYGDHFQDEDELAWAACELFLATGDLKYEEKLREWYPDPGDAKTHFWSWWHASFAYGAALRSYAFGASSGRLERRQL